MTSDTHSQSEWPEGEELVAYLDGELPVDACRRIEQRLGTDAAYRRQLHELDQAWEALDVLPRATVDENFARTTIEMVTMAAKHDLAAQTVLLPVTRRKWTLLIAAVCAAAATVGFAAVRVLGPERDERLLADLPVITQVDVLSQVNDVEFLRGLSQMPLVRLADDEKPLDQELDQLHLASSSSLDARRKWVEQLSADDKAELAAKWKRFGALSPAPQEQERLHELDQEIAQAADAAKLQKTLLAYGQWLARRTAGEQAELRGLPTDERLRRVEQFALQDNRQAARQLSPEDEKALRDALMSFVADRRQIVLEQMRQRGINNPEQRLDERRGAVGLFVVLRELQNERTRTVLVDRLTSQLSPEAQQHLQSLGPGMRERQLRQWIRDAFQPDLNPEELERFFADELDNNQREWLLSLPPSEMQAELEQLYFGAGAPLGLRGMEGMRGFGGPGQFGRGRGGPGGGPPWGPRGQGPGQGQGRRGGPLESPPPNGFGPDRFEGGPGGPPWDDRGPPDRHPPPPLDSPDNPPDDGEPIL